ncbi:MAG: hypothetical protein AB8F78_07250 [Saprospiraceae bacterium]
MIEWKLLENGPSGPLIAIQNEYKTLYVKEIPKQKNEALKSKPRLAFCLGGAKIGFSVYATTPREKKYHSIFRKRVDRRAQSCITA